MEARWGREFGAAGGPFAPIMDPRMEGGAGGGPPLESRRRGDVLPGFLAAIEPLYAT